MEFMSDVSKHIKILLISLFSKTETLDQHLDLQHMTRLALPSIKLLWTTFSY